MKNHFAVTISDATGSRHYTVKKTIRRYLVLTLLLIIAIAPGSISYNYLLYQQSDNLHDRNVRLDHHNTWLNESLTRHNQQTQEMNRELGQIERSNQLEVGGDRTALAQRIRAIGQLYSSREAQYSEIGQRLTQLEAQIEDITTPPTAPRDGEYKTFAERMDTAAFSVWQEVVLHSSIPSGFPTKSRAITSHFGNRIHPITKRKAFHHGVDIRAKGGNVHATADGIVRAADYSELSGNRVIVQHNFGFESYYAHLEKMNVKPGDIIHKGDVVGVSGNSGRSTGPHLHYEVHYLGRSLDPIEFLQWEFGSHQIFSQVKDIKWPSLINLINKQITHPTLQLSQLDPVSPERSR